MFPEIMMRVKTREKKAQISGFCRYWAKLVARSLSTRPPKSRKATARINLV